VPGRLWAALTPDAPSTRAAALALAAGESAGYRLHAARGGLFLVQLAGAFSAGDIIRVDAGGESTFIPVRHDAHAVTTGIRLTAGENPLRIAVEAGSTEIELITMSSALGDGDEGPVGGVLSGYGKALLDPTPRADADIEATVAFTATESGGHGDLLLRASALSEGGEGADTRLGVNFLLGYSVQLHADRVVLARHDYDERILASAAADVGSEAPHRVVVRLRGERIAVELDGVPIIDVADVLPHAAGATGIRAAGGDLRVEGLVVRGTAHT
jgi:hypothetical protein